MPNTARKSIIQTARQSRAAKPTEPPAPAATTPTATPVPPIAPAKIVHACGHAVGLAFLQEQPCRACADFARRQKKQRQAKNRNEVRNGRDAAQSQRLPDGAQFSMTFDASATLWRGTLVVSIGGEMVTLSAEASGVMRLLQRLDGEYREAIKKQANKAT